MNRTGVAGIAKNRGTLHEIHLSNLYIHDVEGNVYDKHMNNGGIYFTCLKPEAEEKTGVARYENVVLDDGDVVLFGIRRAFTNLTLDGFFALIVAGIAGIDHGSHGKHLSFYVMER